MDSQSNLDLEIGIVRDVSETLVLLTSLSIVVVSQNAGELLRRVRRVPKSMDVCTRKHVHEYIQATNQRKKAEYGNGANTYTKHTQRHADMRKCV